MLIRKVTSRKLLVASIGIATASYMGCSQTSGNFVACEEDCGTGAGGTATSTGTQGGEGGAGGGGSNPTAGGDSGGSKNTGGAGGSTGGAGCH